ncbi:MAG: hypothetical protein NXH97_12595 [Rhodobacteraceae bacterium]|nr:hypothetical protein [Paracoccaceae bacterium]
MWWKSRKHRPATVGGVIVLVVCFAALFADFTAPADPNPTHPRHTYAPPQSLGLFIDGDGFRLMWVATS